MRKKERSVAYIFRRLCSLWLFDCTVFGSHVARGLQYSAVHRVRNAGKSNIPGNCELPTWGPCTCAWHIPRSSSDFIWAMSH